MFLRVVFVLGRLCVFEVAVFWMSGVCFCLGLVGVW